MQRRTKTVETWAWVLIYAGLFLAALGWFMRRAAGPWGESLLVGGALVTLAGGVLVVVRSRMKDGT